jgi:hypothetical protein
VRNPGRQFCLIQMSAFAASTSALRATADKPPLRRDLSP